eukprot:Opistho-2@89244
MSESFLALLGVLHGGASHALAGNDQLHDLRRSVADFQAHHVAQALLVRQVHRPAIVPKGQQALVNRVKSGLGAHPLDHGRFRGVRLTGIAQGQAVVAELAASGDQGLELDKGKAHALVLRQRRAKGLAFLHVFPGFVDRGLRGGHALQRDQDAAEVKALHHLREAFALLAQPVLDRHPHIVEKHRTTADDLATNIVEARALHAGLIQIDQEGADASCDILGLAGACEQHHGIGLVGKSDGGFLAGKHVLVAHATRLELQIGGIRAAPWFGQTQRDDGLARHDPAVPGARQLGGRIGMDDGAHQRTEQLHVADVEVTIGNFLGDHAGRDATEAQAAIFLGQINTDQTERTHFLEQGPVDARLRFALLVIGPELLSCKAARHVTQRNLVIVEHHG